MNIKNGEQDKTLEEFSFIDKSVLKTLLICNVCGKLLNVAPVIYSETLGYICGRCSPNTSTTGLGAMLRQKIFEDLMQHLTFPCTNKNFGCVEILKYDEVQEHEKSCRFQCINCPLSYKQFLEKPCSWIGNINLASDHLKTHQDEFLDPPQFEWPVNNENKLFFTTVGNQIMTVVIKHEKEKYFCLVMINGTDLDSQCFRYQLELTDEDKSSSMVLRKNRLYPLSCFLDNLNCPDKVLLVDIAKISEMLQTTKKVIAKLGITKKNKKELAQITGSRDIEIAPVMNAKINKEKDSPPDEEMLAELECPVCNNYMIPPIYICTTGHSVCSDCKTKVKLCPTCRCQFADGRNFTLEKLTLKVNYPCRNREIGCGFVSTSDKIIQHENVCELSEFPCILSCGWSGRFPGLYGHFVDKHNGNLLEHGEFILKDSKPDRYVCYFFLYVMGELFCLTYQTGNKHTIKFNIWHVGYSDNELKYKYTIQFYGKMDYGSPNISLTNFCQSWNGVIEQDSIDMPNATFVSGDLLKSVIANKKFYYFRICITKVEQ